MVTNSNKADCEVAEGDSVTGVVIFVDSQARVVELSCQPELLAQVEARTEQTAKVGAKLRGRVVLSKTEHGVSLVLVSHPRALAGLLGWAATKRHHNDLAGLEQGELGRQVGLVVQEVTARGEPVLVMKTEARRAEAKLGKRSRSQSQSEDVKVKRKRSSESEVVPAEDIKQGQEPEITAGENPPAEKSGKKKKSKKRKRKESGKSTAEEDPVSSNNNAG